MNEFDSDNNELNNTNTSADTADIVASATPSVPEEPFSSNMPDAFTEFETPIISTTTKVPKKKKSPLLKILVPLVAVIVLAAGGLIFYARAELTPEKVVKKATTKAFDFDSPYDKLLGSSEIKKYIADQGAYSKGFSGTLLKLDLEDADFDTSMLEGVGLSMESSIDVKKKIATALFGVIYGDTKCLSLNAKLDDSKVSLSVPELVDALFSLDLSTLGKDLNNSMLLEDALDDLPTEIDDSFSIDAWKYINGEFLSALTDSMKKRLNTCIDKLVIEKIKADSIDLPSDVNAKKVYKVTLTEENITELVSGMLSDVMDFAREKGLLEMLGGSALAMPTTADLKLAASTVASEIGDVSFHFVIGKNGSLTYAELPLSISPSQKALLSLRCKDSKNPTEEIILEFTDYGSTSVKMLLKTSKDGDTYKYNFTVTSKATLATSSLVASHTINTKTGEFTIDARLLADDAADDFKFEAKGRFTDIVKGKKYTTALDYAELSYNDVFDLSIAGTSYVDTTKSDLSFSASKDYEILKLDETDLMVIGADAMTNIQNNPLFKDLIELFQ